MQKAIWIGLVVVLIISLLGLFTSLKAEKKLKGVVEKAIKRLASDIREVENKTAPYVYTGEAVGFVIEFENGAKFYIAADTGISADLKFEVGDYYQPDVAILPIGNYYTMDPKAAAYAAKLIDPAKYVIPSHYACHPMLVQEPDGFFAELKKYELRAKPLKFEEGVEQEIMGVRAMWLGHTDWLFTSPQGTRILIDPEVHYNPSFPEKYKDLTKFKKIDLILISHGHFDHMTVPDLRKWNKLYKPIYIVPFEAGVWLKETLGYTDIVAVNKGSNISKAEMLGIGMPAKKVKKIAEGIRIHLVSATHSSSAIPEGLPARY